MWFVKLEFLPHFCFLDTGRGMQIERKKLRVPYIIYKYKHAISALLGFICQFFGYSETFADSQTLVDIFTHTHMHTHTLHFLKNKNDSLPRITEGKKLNKMDSAQ